MRSLRLTRVRVDLRPCSLPREVDVDRLPLGEDVEARDARLAVAVARVLHAAERQVHLGADRRGVDVEDARLELAHRREGLVDVPRVDRAGQPVRRQSSRRGSPPRASRSGRPSSPGPKISSQAMRICASASAKTVGSRNQPLRELALASSFAPPVTSFAPSFLPISTYFATVSRWRSETHGPMSTLSSRPLPTRSAFARARAARRTRRRRRAVDEEPRGRRAALAGRAERAPQRAVHREIHVGVVHDEDRVLAAHLEVQPLERRRARRRDDRAPDLGRAREGDDLHVGCETSGVADLARRRRSRR